MSERCRNWRLDFESSSGLNWTLNALGVKNVGAMLVTSEVVEERIERLECCKIRLLAPHALFSPSKNGPYRWW